MSDEDPGLSETATPSRISQFEDLIAWQKARLLTGAVYRATRTPPFAQDRGLATQIQRAATSVMANIAEGFERGSRAEFYHYLTMAKGSCAEVSSHLYVAYDAGHISPVLADELQDQANEVTRILGGLRASVARQRDAERNRTR